MAFLGRGLSKSRYFCRVPLLSVTSSHLSKYRIPAIRDDVTRTFSVSSRLNDLHEFFDDEENWRQQKVKVGRPWELDDLRIKSNSDLHKLWFVLLKEWNMLLTMTEFYDQESEHMPSPQRLFKVEHSMENILQVVNERNEAYNLLEKGETGEAPIVTERNFLGLKYQHRAREHSIPKEQNRLHRLLHPENCPRSTLRYINFYKEKLRKEESRHKKKAENYKKKLIGRFPNLKDNKEFMDKDPCDVYPVKFNPEIWDDVDEDYYSHSQ